MSSRRGGQARPSSRLNDRLCGEHVVLVELRRRRRRAPRQRGSPSGALIDAAQRQAARVGDAQARTAARPASTCRRPTALRAARDRPRAMSASSPSSTGAPRARGSGTRRRARRRAARPRCGAARRRRAAGAAGGRGGAGRRAANIGAHLPPGDAGRAQRRERLRQLAERAVDRAARRPGWSRSAPGRAAAAANDGRQRRAPRPPASRAARRSPARDRAIQRASASA